MSNKTTPRINRTGEIMTRENLIPLFEDIKELIVSTAKGTETVLRKELQKEISAVKKEIGFTQQALKATKDELNTKIDATKDELRSEIRDAEGRLTDKIDSIHVRIDDHEGRIATLETPHP